MVNRKAVCMKQQIGEEESSTGQGTANVEDVYLEELSEAAYTSMDTIRAEKGVGKDDGSSKDSKEGSATRGHEFVSDSSDESGETDRTEAHCLLIATQIKQVWTKRFA